MWACKPVAGVRANLIQGLVGALALACAPAFAQAGATCRLGGSVAETNACAVQAFQAADTTIALLYSDMMRALSAHERPQLRQEHSAWQRARTLRCKQATRATEQQPDAPQIYHECLTRETQARRQGLMRWLSADPPLQP